jgi:DNA-binding NarL/FixJ family response regulator
VVNKLSPIIDIYLLAENRLLRDTLAKLIKRRYDINVVGVSQSFASAKDELVSSSCEVILTDSFDDLTWAGSPSSLLEQRPEIKVILFGMNEDPALFLRAAHRGICGYLLKDASSAEIVAAIHAASRGEATCPPSLCMSLIKHVSKRGGTCAGEPDTQSIKKKPLTRRQLQLLTLVDEGLTNKEIAVRLNLSQFTVKNHIRRVMQQVAASNRFDAADLVRETGQLAAR